MSRLDTVKKLWNQVLVAFLKSIQPHSRFDGRTNQDDLCVATQRHKLTTFFGIVALITLIKHFIVTLTRLMASQ